jgi:WD40 repeat protein
VAFSPDGKTLATASGDGTARLWEVTTGHPVRDLVTGHTHGVYSVGPVAYSPDGKTLASGGVDGTVRLWDVATRTDELVTLADTTVPTRDHSEIGKSVTSARHHPRCRNPKAYQAADCPTGLQNRLIGAAPLS